MTEEEALGVAKLIAEADGGCPYCVALLIGRANVLFPDHNWRRLVRFVNPQVLEFPDDASKIFNYRESVRSSLEHAKNLDRPLDQHREAMKERRRRAARLFAVGMPLVEVARKLRVSRTAVYAWHRAWQAEGSSFADGPSEKSSS